MLDVELPEVTERPKWPTDGLEQIRLVRDLLAKAPAPSPPDAIANVAGTALNVANEFRKFWKRWWLPALLGEASTMGSGDTSYRDRRATQELRPSVRREREAGRNRARWLRRGSFR